MESISKAATASSGRDKSYSLNTNHNWGHPDNGGFIDAYIFQNEDDSSLTNDYAQGHFINHPPKGVLPNVAVNSFFWQDLLSSLESKESNSTEDYQYSFHAQAAAINPMPTGPWYIDSSTLNVINYPEDKDSCIGSGNVKRRKGAYFFSNREIYPDEELFFDYSFSDALANKLSSWYSPVSYSKNSSWFTFLKDC